MEKENTKGLPKNQSMDHSSPNHDQNITSELADAIEHLIYRLQVLGPLPE